MNSPKSFIHNIQMMWMVINALDRSCWKLRNRYSYVPSWIQTCCTVPIVMAIYRPNMHSNAWLSRPTTKPTKWHVRPAKTQISLGIRPVWSESSLSAWRKLGSFATYWAHSEDSDQTGRMPMLIWGFAGRTCHSVGFDMRRLISLGIFCCSFRSVFWTISPKETVPLIWVFTLFCFILPYDFLFR